ncbi:MAG TPA: hypothetical protein VL947_14365, partial [Cytophagales bacterium]|nr:hypothetical protein [Cytophagales bacterium]
LTVVKNANGRSVIDFSGLPNNSEYQYFWYQKSGSDVLLQDLHTRTPSFINAALGNYKFRVMIKRPDGNTSYRDVLITVSNVVTTLDDVDLEHAFKTWQLYDPTGKKIREGNESKINLADLVTGMYIVNNENGRFKIYLK